MNTINLNTDNPGMELKVARTRERYSLQQLGEKVGVSHNYIFKLEKNENKPSDGIIIKLAEALNVKEDDLFLLFNEVPPFIKKLLLRHPQLIEGLSTVNSEENKLTPEKEKEFLISVINLYNQALSK